VASTVAVLVAAYNAERTIRQAVESVLAGGFPCDVFVIDDASRTSAADALGDLRGRVTAIRLARNVGPAAARNAGLAAILAGGYRYVAIMDADDVSRPGRLARQAAFLDAHPTVGAVGTFVRFCDEATGETIFVRERPTDPAGVRNMMFFNIGLSHASAMMRCDVLRMIGGYSTDYPAAEDYELMQRIAAVSELANIPEVLLDYRVSARGQSMARRRRQLVDRLRIQLTYFRPLQWRAWAGAAQTLVLLGVPVGLATRLKTWLRPVTPAARPSSS